MSIYIRFVINDLYILIYTNIMLWFVCDVYTVLCLLINKKFHVRNILITPTVFEVHMCVSICKLFWVLACLMFQNPN